MGDEKKKEESKMEDATNKRSFKAEVRKTVDQMKQDFKTIGQGFVRDMSDLGKTPFQVARDMHKFGTMIAQGKYKEATGKAAQKISENLKGMINLGMKDESKLYGISKIQNRTIRKMEESYREIKRDIKGFLNRLSGRSGVQAVKSVVRISGKEREGGR